MQWSTPTWVFLPFKTPSMTGVRSTEPNYSLIQTHSYNLYQKKTTSYGDWKEDGQLTCNQEQEISSLVGNSSRQIVQRLDSCQLISLWNTLYSDCWLNKWIKKSSGIWPPESSARNVFATSTSYPGPINFLNDSILFVNMRYHKVQTWDMFELSLYWVNKPSYLLTYLLTYSMEQSHSWEANWFCS